jgi:hypothetical protein
MGSIADFLAAPEPKATPVADPALDSWLDTPRREPAKPDQFWDSVEAPPPPTGRHGTITYYPEMDQGSEEWYAARCGLLTASEMKLIITPTLKVASNEKERAHLYELLAQRITKYVEPSYVSDDMLRGKEDEIFARQLYSEHYAPVTEMGFITNDRWGFTIGYSPDGLVGADGLIEGKSRRQKFQVETIIENVPEDTVPPAFGLQLQTGLTVSERKWIDFISYSGGLHMLTIRVYPIPEVQEAIINAAGEFERRLAIKWERYRNIIASKARLIPTERRIIQEMHL